MAKKYPDETPLDEYENNLKMLIDSGTLRSIPDVENEKKKHEQIASNTLKLLKKKTINIRISDDVLFFLKKKSTDTGIPYQTIISSLLHQYATGRIVVEL
jgi:predicted DNA binding CopG/RHH family protein